MRSGGRGRQLEGRSRRIRCRMCWTDIVRRWRWTLAFVGWRRAHKYFIFTEISQKSAVIRWLVIEGTVRLFSDSLPICLMLSVSTFRFEYFDLKQRWPEMRTGNSQRSWSVSHWLWHTRHCAASKRWPWGPPNVSTMSLSGVPLSPPCLLDVNSVDIQLSLTNIDASLFGFHTNSRQLTFVLLICTSNTP